MAEPIVGIDLGTTNSLVAVCDARGPRVIPGDSGDALLPSVVRYEAGPQGRLATVVGKEARDHSAEFPHTTVSSVKRLMGRSKADAAADLPYLSYHVVEGEHNTARVELPVGGSGGGPSVVIVSPQEVSAVILRALKERASRALGVEVRKAVVTVPAYFDDAQRQATRDAGRLAGLEVVRIVNEPTAAALAYGLGLRDAAGGAKRSARGPSIVAVYDLGGGTFDISILRLTRDGSEGTEFFQVVSTAGDTHLGGDDVDQMLVELFLREIDVEFERAGAADAEVSAGGRQALRLAAERAKRELSDREETQVEVQVDHVLYRRRIARAELETLVAGWVERTIVACQRAVRDAKRDLGGAPIEVVVMVGGATRMPIVRRRVREFFGIEPYTAIDPDRVVALGAAVQGAVLGGEITGALLLDVIPLSLGIETAGGAVAKLVMRNSTVPARATEMFSTSVDGQTSIKLHIVQGEREMVADCRSLGVFHLRGLPPMPAGIPQVEVEFLVDANGVLNVSAQERRSGRRTALQIVPNHGLSRDEVERMEAEAFANAREDMTRHRVADLVVNARLDLKWIGERLARHRSRLDPAYAASLAAGIERLAAEVSRAESDWRSVDPDQLHRLKDELDRASVRLQEVGIAESLREDAGGGQG